jgi:hypothetical protein
VEARLGYFRHTILLVGALANVCRLSSGDTHRLRVVLACNDGTELAARSQVVTVELAP